MKYLTKSSFLLLSFFVVFYACQKDDSSIIYDKQKSKLNSRLQIKQGSEVSQKALAFINYRTTNSSFVAIDKNRITLS